jgi:hypothetical protein
MSMSPKAAYVTLAFQGIVLAALLAIGGYVHQLKSAIELHETRAVTMPASVSTAQVSQPRLESTPHEGAAASLAFVEPLQELAHRMQRLEAQVGEFSVIVSSPSNGAGASTSAATGRRVKPSADDAAEMSRLRAQADLASRHANESSTSSWGRSAAAGIDSAYADAYATSPFFAEYGGNVTADCRESVCSLAWAPGSAAMAALSEEERADMLERAKFELIGLAGRAGEAGQFTVTVNAVSSPPSVQLMVDHAVGGDRQIPDRVSSYLSTSKE